MKNLLMILVMASVLLSGCKGEDGADGKIYLEMQWTSDVNMIDISEVILGGENPALFYQERLYELEPGKEGLVGWRSDSDWYYISVKNPSSEPGQSGGSNFILIPENGSSGIDRVIEVFMTGGSIYIGDRYQNSYGERSEIGVKGGIPLSQELNEAIKYIDEVE